MIDSYDKREALGFLSAVPVPPCKHVRHGYTSRAYASRSRLLRALYTFIVPLPLLSRGPPKVVAQALNLRSRTCSHSQRDRTCLSTPSVLTTNPPATPTTV